MFAPETLCQVDNCFQCIVENRCGLCDPGFTLNKNGSCIKNACPNINNC